MIPASEGARRRSVQNWTGGTGSCRFRHLYYLCHLGAAHKVSQTGSEAAFGASSEAACVFGGMWGVEAPAKPERIDCHLSPEKGELVQANSGDYGEPLPLLVVF